MIDSVQPDIVIGTESWLTNDTIDSSVFPTDDYTVFRRDRGTRGGGVFILVKNNIEASREEELETGCEIVWCKVSLQNSKTLHIGAYYRPNETDEDSTEQLNTSLQRLHSSSSAIILGGDFNAPGWDWANNNFHQNCRTPGLHERLVNILDDAGLAQVVDSPTRERNILDLICTNTPLKVANIDILPGISDHHIASCYYNTQPLRRLQKPRKILQYSKADWNGIATSLNQLHTSLKSQAANLSTEDLWCKFKNTLLELITKFIPSKTTKRIHKLPYVTRDIEKLINKRNRLYKKLKRRQQHFDQSHPSLLNLNTRVKSLRKEIQQKMRRSYWTYIENIITPSNENEEDPYKGMKRFWQFIKSNKKDNQGVATLKARGKTSSTPIEKATALNEQFQSVFSPHHQAPDDLLPTSRHPSSPEIRFSLPGIEKLLSKLKPHKAAGPDNITARVLKQLSTSIAPILHIIFKKSYESGELPNDWKDANVVPIYKKGQKSNPANYRPISLTCICCKVLEHIIASNIMQHARSKNILYQLQHGFLDKRSCETQLIEFQADILNNLSQNQQTDVLIMDFSKAFDKVSHHHLIRKLDYYGIRGKTNRWIKEFLTDRRQCVVIEGEKSSQVPVTSGVPQGSVLGPPLFLYYINDIAEKLTSTVRLFADDTVAYLAIKGEADARILQADLDKLGQWEQKWVMEFHPDKCQVLTISKKKKNIKFPYYLHGHQLEHVSEAKYLGITITNDFRWNTHINNINAKASRSLSFLKRNLQINAINIKETAYKAIVRPLVEYAPCVWDPSTKTNIDKLEMIQRRAARYVLNRYHNTSSVDDMLNQLKWPTLQDRRKTSRLSMLYKIVHSQVEVQSHHQHLIPCNRQSRHNNSKSYQVPDTTKGYIQDSFYPRTIREWNSLPEDTVTAPSISSFKNKLIKL